MRIGIIGYGSWGTALVQHIATKKIQVNWWLPKKEIAEHIRKHKKNPKYLKNATLNTKYIYIESQAETFLKNTDVLFLIVPSAYLDTHLHPFREYKEMFKEKLFFSGIKGFEISSQKIITEYLSEEWSIPANNIGVIAGPAHAEEVVLGKETVLTLAFSNENFKNVAEILRSDSLYILTSSDVIGIEYAAILKNIYALTIGILLGSGYGDNFIAMSVCSCINEMELILEKIHPVDWRTIIHSAYLGDFLVTAYSQFSRNRTFGTLIGQGASKEQAKQKIGMVAEGVLALKIFVEKYLREHTSEFPIIHTVYEILYRHLPPSELGNRVPKI